MQSMRSRSRWNMSKEGQGVHLPVSSRAGGGRAARDPLRMCDSAPIQGIPRNPAHRPLGMTPKVTPRLAFLTALATTLVLSCSSPSTPTNVTPETSTLPTVTLADGYVVRVEVAANDELRAQGLMFRDRLREGYGMIFLFPRTGVYPF